jgi:hypothetical protein
MTDAKFEVLARATAPRVHLRLACDPLGLDGAQQRDGSGPGRHLTTAYHLERVASESATAAIEGK